MNISNEGKTRPSDGYMAGFGREDGSRPRNLNVVAQLLRGSPELKAQVVHLQIFSCQLFGTGSTRCFTGF